MLFRSPASFHGQPEKINVAKLSVPLRHVEQSLVAQRNRVVPELVMPARTQLPQTFDQLGCRRELRTVRGVRHDADESVFGDGTRRPSQGSVIGKPVVGDFVMDVLGIKKRDKEVDVEQCDPIHSSSRNRFTWAIVISRAPGR